MLDGLRDQSVFVFLLFDLLEFQSFPLWKPLFRPVENYSVAPTFYILS